MPGCVRSPLLAPVLARTRRPQQLRPLVAAVRRSGLQWAPVERRFLVPRPSFRNRPHQSLLSVDQCATLRQRAGSFAYAPIYDELRFRSMVNAVPIDREHRPCSAEWARARGGSEPRVDGSRARSRKRRAVRRAGVRGGAVSEHMTS